MTTSELMEAMANAGAPFEAILIAVRAIEMREAEFAAALAGQQEKPRSSAASRQARYRARKNSEKTVGVTLGDVTSDASRYGENDAGCDNGGVTVTPPSLSLSPNENNSNPHTHTHPDNIPAREAVDPSEGLGEFEPDPVPSFTPDDLWRMWNRAAQEMGLPKVREMTEARQKRALTMIRKYGREGFVEAISAIERSTFLRGQTEQQFKADLDFLLQQKSFTRLIEGFYDRTSRANSRSRYEPDGAMAYLQSDAGIGPDYGFAGTPGRWDDHQPEGGDCLPYP